MQDIYNPRRIIWSGRELVRISDVIGFEDWLEGMDIPIVDEVEDPTDWAYTYDYNQYLDSIITTIGYEERKW